MDNDLFGSSTTMPPVTVPMSTGNGTNVITIPPMNVRIVAAPPEPKAPDAKRDLRSKQTRDFEITDLKVVREKGDEGPALYEVAVSSETEIERWFGIEVLDHGKGAVDMSRMKRGAAVLVDHYGDQVGVVEDFRIDDDKVARAHLRFSESVRGQEVERDVATKVRRNISVGYFIKKYKKVEDRKVGQDEQGHDITIPVYRVTRWQPAEVSLVSVPADITVGVGRDAGSDGPVLEVEAGDEAAVSRREEPQMDEKDKDKAAPVVTVDNEAARTSEIVALCRAAKRDDLAPAFIASTLTPAAVAARLEAARAAAGPAQPAAEQVVSGIPAKDRRRYSYHRAIKNAVAAMEGKGKMDGVEFEMHRELESHWPTGASRKGTLLVPMDLRTDDEKLELMYRTMTGIDVGKGVETVFQQYGQLIDMLRNRARVIQAGAQVLTGLTGPVGFPRLVSGPSVEWAAENPATGTTAADITFGMTQVSQKTLRGLSGFTRQLLAQSSIDVEGTTRNELAFGHSLAIDRGAIHGSGSAGQPLGIYRTPNVNTETYAGAPVYADIINQIVSIHADNADVANMRWLTTPEIAGKLLQTQRFTSTDTPLWTGSVSDGVLGGYGAATTNQISKTMSTLLDTGGAQHGIVFGNWAELLIAMFGALDLLLDPYTSADKQIIKVHSFQMSDIALLHPESFCVSTGATP